LLGIGLWEILFIFLIALLIFGPRQLPEIARALGKGMYWLKNASSNLTQQISKELSDIEAEGKAGRKGEDEGQQKS
jgi:TatA/E family protein of Tat protein translocase